MHTGTEEQKKEILGVYGYKEFINGVKKSEINIDRKILADIAKNNPNTFKFIVDKIRQTK